MNLQAVVTNLEDYEQALGERLIARGKLDRAGLERARRIRTDTGERLSSLLPKLGLVSERDMAAAIAEQLELPIVSPREFPDQPLFKDRLSPRFLREAQVLPIAEEANGLVVAMADPLNQYAADALRMVAGKALLPRVAAPGDLEAAIDRLYARDSGDGGAQSTTAEDFGDGLDLDVERLRDLASEAPVIRLVNQLITRAVEARASDIHIEPFETALRVRFRIDGVLREIEPPPNRFRAAIVSRIKIMAKLNIAERRLPQDGRIKLAIRGTPIDLRVSTVPTMHGEGVVLRVLDRTGVQLDLAALGVGDRTLHTFLRILERPHGIVLVTGPTGSGKTTTLYASLVRLNSPDKKILTVEDPIEYQLDGINQIQVKPSIGLSFANVLRSILRQDPDIIMIGEIRDSETAEIAIQAALTGHLVLSTLHTNDAASTISRLLDMGAEDYLLTSTLNGVAAQRLVRTLCTNCRTREPALPEIVEQLGLRRYTAEPDIYLYKAEGCEECNGTGFRGRSSLIEILVVTDAIRRLILRRAEAMELHRAAVEEGMRTMFDDGMEKALAGLTTVEEVLRVTREV
ncbi:MAG: type II secretion system protein GspE [Alphaproteobacteria bacterium]|nr:MAG: type II secretion system protein GspE [Alphaproteobacteria bacterium]